MGKHGANHNVFPQPLAGKISLAIALRKDVKDVQEGNCGHQKEKSDKESEDLVKFYIPHNKQQNS